METQGKLDLTEAMDTVMKAAQVELEKYPFCLSCSVFLHAHERKNGHPCPRCGEKYVGYKLPDAS